ncbi:hypothetical protein J3R30DRAFT_3718132 [Lentinula aciculospora]|uniref:Uncharacterized protein n=1 Tax=Lentinula aciculospora TaxID=153920 RepID=A0A9W9DF15_9AGAR|nr:hypothetical protein J3R30DRAFT_3718132 [Lentinula aciculospora]
MIASSEFTQEPWYKTTNGTGISVESLNASARSTVRLNALKKPSLYSIITGRNSSLFSNPSQQTVTASTSLQSSTFSFPNQPDRNISRLRFLRLKKAKSTVNMQSSVSPSAVVGPSKLSRVHSITAIPQNRPDLWIYPPESGDTESENLDRPLNTSRITVANSDTPQVSVRVVGRGGQGSRLRPANQRISHLHQSLRDQPITSVDLSDRSDAKAPAVPGPISIARVVGRGGLGSKRRVHLNPSSTFISPSVPSNFRVSPHERAQSTSTQSVSILSGPSAQGPSSLQSPTIRVNGRGGAASRLRVRPPSPPPGQSLATMCKLKWKNRKRAKSDIGVVLENPHPRKKFASFRRPRANTIPELDINDKSRPLPAIPASPPPSTTVDVEPDPNFTSASLSVYVHPSESDVRVPAAPRNKLERTLGDAVPSNMLLSTNANHLSDNGAFGRKYRRRSRGSTHSLSSLGSTAKSQRRRSVARSLSSLGSFIRRPSSRPSSEVYVYTEEGDNDFDVIEDDDDKEEVCWIDNEFDSYSREGATTPISPMIFSVRPPSPTPPPKPKLSIDSVVPADETLASVVSVSTCSTDGQDFSELDSEDGGEEEEVYTHSEVFTPATLSDDSAIPDTSLSSFASACPCSDVPPVSPIVFSEAERPPSTASLSTPRSRSKSVEFENTPRTQLRALSLEPIPPNTTSSPASPASPPDSPFHGSFSSHPRRELREGTGVILSPHGWTGEWNRKDMQDVIQSLRELK